MNKALAVGLLVAGIIMLVFGFNSKESAASEISEVFSGSPTDKTMWLLIGGGVLAVIGAVGLFLGGRRAATV